jgi:hypothetical protein
VVEDELRRIGMDVQLVQLLLDVLRAKREDLQISAHS